MEKLNQLKDPKLISGGKNTAYRDPAAAYHKGEFYLYFTLVESRNGEDPYLFTAMSRSRDLVNWSEITKITPRDKSLNFSSPGNVFYHNDRWHMCLQTYCRENGEKYGNKNSRVFLMDSSDLVNWSEPRLLRVKGDHVPRSGMGRMIDPYVIRDKDDPGLWWCLYKQNGVSFSSSRDLKSWTYEGSREAGENVCLLENEGDYWLFHSPRNGIGIKRSLDLKNWEDLKLLTLGQDNWEWAKGRITAGFVLDGREIDGVNAWLMFFHGSGPGDESVCFDNHASLGIAWSRDLLEWEWPGQHH